MLFRLASAVSNQLHVSVCICYDLSGFSKFQTIMGKSLPLPSREHSLGTVEVIMRVQRGFSLRQLLTLEPVLFLYAFGLFMNVPVSQQYIYSRLSEAKGFPYHFQQKTGCEGKELNDSMKNLEKEVLATLCFIQDKLFLYYIILQSFRFLRITERMLAYHSTGQHFSFILHYLTLHRNSCKEVCIF